jgi:hypothetical protein
VLEVVQMLIPGRSSDLSPPFVALACGALAAGMLGAFDDPQASAIGTNWVATSDRMAGGQSEASVAPLAGGAAAVSLASRNPPGLVAIVNISGGLSLTNCVEKGNPELVRTFGLLAGRSKVPQLWIYADNDELFPVALVNQMHEAALNAKGDVRRVSIPKLEPRGHNVSGSNAGRRIWLREVDNSLRGWKLPTHRPSVVVDWLKAMDLTSKDQNMLERYLSDPNYKALAFSAKEKRLFWRFGGGNARDATEGAMKDCAGKFQDCQIVLEGTQLKRP